MVQSPMYENNTILEIKVQFEVGKFVGMYIFLLRTDILRFRNRKRGEINKEFICGDDYAVCVYSGIIC